MLPEVMSAYFFQIELPPFTEEMECRVPAHHRYVNKLFAEGRILSYSVSLSRNHIWCVVPAENEQEAMELIASFPLQPYFSDVHSHSLLFHNAMPAVLHGISLN